MEFIAILFPLIFIGGIFVLVIPLIIHHQKQMTQSWSEAARNLGLHLQPPRFFQSARMYGVYHGFGVDIRLRRQNKHTYTVFSVSYPRPLGLGLQLSREYLLTGLTKMFGAQDIEIGDAQFDADVVIKGADPARIKAFLTPARRMRIHRLLSTYADVTIRDHDIFARVAGSLSNAGSIVSRVQAMTRLAWYLIADREADAVVTKAMQAQNDGRAEEALWILDEHVKQRDQKHTERVAEIEASESTEEYEPEPVEERLMEGELLYLGGRKEEAQEMFERAHQESPDDVELQEWSEHAERDVAESAATNDEEYPLDVTKICEVLFDSNNSSFVSARLFEEHYQGRRIEWNGRLEKVERYSYDYVLGREPGVKAVFEIHTLQAEYYGERHIRAVVQFPESAQEELEPLVGDSPTFTGELLKVDGFMRNLYLANGAIQ